MIYISKGIKCILALGLAMLLFFLLFFAKDVSTAVFTGITICLEILIPSLYLFLVVASFTVSSGWLDPLFKPFGFLLGKLFHIDTSLGALLFMSLCCGYPVGGKLLSQMVLEGRLSVKTANRMLAYCVNAGPAFLIGSVALPLFGDVRFGWVLFLSQICGFLAVGILSGIREKPECCKGSSSSKSFSDALVSSVLSSSRSMLTICSFVILFSGLIGLLKLLGWSDAISSLLSPFISQANVEGALYGILEVSGGILSLKHQGAFYLALLLSSFGGLCVHMQIISMIRPAGLSLKKFYLYRPLYIFVSFISSKFLLSFLQLDVCTGAMNPGIQRETFSTLPLCSFFLILLSITLLLCDKKSVIIQKRRK